MAESGDFLVFGPVGALRAARQRLKMRQPLFSRPFSMFSSLSCVGLSILWRVNRGNIWHRTRFPTA